jgi:hypothetical protein
MASTLTNLLFHLVFSTKHREPLITPDFRDKLYAYIGGRRWRSPAMVYGVRGREALAERSTLNTFPCRCLP